METFARASVSLPLRNPPHRNHLYPVSRHSSLNFNAAREHFADNFVSRAELGASVSVWQDEREILSLAGGFEDREQTLPWTPQTAVLVWSATKGPSASCVLHALEEEHVSLETTVSHLWPEFATNGKASVTLRMLLQHQAGLCALDNPPPVEDRQAVTSALAAQTPAWEPGTAQGYHPRTFGFLLDELLHRLTGASLGLYWRSVFAAPLGLDFWIGLPDPTPIPVAPIFSPKSNLPKGDPFLTAFMTSGSLTSRSFASPRGLHSAAAMNDPLVRQVCYPGWGGIGTASALAKFYFMLANDGCFAGKRYLKSETLLPLQTGGTQDMDRVLHIETLFSHGFMRDPLAADGTKQRSIFGPSPAAFGHPGAGGCVGFADPVSRLGCAYVMNQMEPGVLPNAKSSGLWNALFGHQA